ncbi:MAG: hypothetical protein LBH28_06100 [Oscillospiraceae bacterium]|jgi:uncharacterized membrane protein YgcG|nr:hypothetical protein [Oscillospiraceae bacterium]
MLKKILTVLLAVFLLALIIAPAALAVGGSSYVVSNTSLDALVDGSASNFLSRPAVKLAIVILIPILIALLICSGWKRKMKTAVIARSADNYIPNDGFKLTEKGDQFLYRTTTRTKIERQSSSSGGRSGPSSSGRSGGGRA